jgi:hypothetical protein
MDFENYAISRDLFYLAALFLGAGCGCFLNRFRIIAKTRFRILSVTAGLCFFSGAAAAFFISIILSNWKIFGETSLYLPMGILAVLVILVFRFPRAAGFPIFLLSCVFVVFIGYTGYRIPVIDNSSLLRLSRDGNNIVRISTVRSNETSSRRTNDDSFLSFQVRGEGSALEINSFSVVPSKVFPVFGGISRGLITEIRYNQTVIYANSQSLQMFFSNPSAKEDSFFRKFMELLLSPMEASGTLEMRKLPTGTHLTIFFEGGTPVFQ